MKSDRGKLTLRAAAATVAIAAVALLIWCGTRSKASVPSHPSLKTEPRSGFSKVAQALFDGPTGHSQSLPFPAALNRTSAQARVYIDTSASTRGFTTGGKQLYGRLLETIKNVLTDKPQIDDFTVRLLDSSLGPSQRGGEFVTYGSPSLYKGLETNLPLATDDAALWRGDGMVLVLTDGVMSIPKSQTAKPGRPSASACASGSDPTCVALSITRYISANSGGAGSQHGHGFWIVGIKMPFSGPHFIEEPGPNPPRRRKITKGPFPNRPFYVWVGSPSLQQGREVVEGLVDFAETNRLEHIVFEVAPGEWSGSRVDPSATLADIRDSADKVCKKGDLRSGFSQNPGGYPSIEAITRKSWGGQPSFGFNLPLSFVDQKPPDFRSLTLAVQKITPQTADVIIDNGNAGAAVPTHARADVCLRFFGALAHSRADQTLPLMGNWAISASAENPWVEWSTDTDDSLRSVNRTLHLDILLSHLRSMLTPADNSYTVALPMLNITYSR